ncbi:MAG: hypothetical protein ABL982_04610 [Vicinamibacterales bacterium]
MPEPLTRPTRAPWHLWVVGAVALLWNAMGAFDYSMTQSRNAAYMAGFTPEQLAFFYGMPAVINSAWAVGVWGGVAGSLLLLLRRRLSVWVFLASVVGVLTTTFHNFVLADGMTVAGDPFSLIFTAVIFIVALGLFLYASTLRTRGVLA